MLKPLSPNINIQSFGDRHLEVKKCFSGRMKVYRHVSTALHILVDPDNVISWRLVLIYMQTPPTHSYVESSGRVAYMETHP
jgi:hypothetical protein